MSVAATGGQTSPSPAAAVAGRRRHVRQIDVLRVVAITLVVADHVVGLILPASHVGGALTIVLHSSRNLFFFMTGLVLMVSSGSADRRLSLWRFWRRRFPPILLPYVVWTFIYWSGDSVGWGNTWPPSPSAGGLVRDLLLGWTQLYFLLVTMEFYVVFPLLAWLVRRLHHWHWLLIGCSLACQLLWTGALGYWRGSFPMGVQGLLAHDDIVVFDYQLYFLLGTVVATRLDAVLAFMRRHARGIVALALAGLLVTELGYLLNVVRFGMPPVGAAVEWQPAVVVGSLSVLALTAVVADRMLRGAAADSRRARALARGADLSFGVFLSHVLVLFILVQPAVRERLGLNELPAIVMALVTFLLTILLSGMLSELMRRSPLSRLLTGRARRTGRRALAPSS
ncbi:MAG: acyltransferase [Candidatus Dormiibacterota bacterium]